MNKKFDESTPIVQLNVGQLRKMYEEAFENQHTQEEKSDKWLSIKASAKYADCGESTLRKHLSKIKSAKIGNKILIRQSELDKFLESQGKELL